MRMLLGAVMLALLTSIAFAGDTSLGQRLVEQLQKNVPGNRFEFVAMAKDGESFRIYYRFMNADTLNVSVCYPVVDGGHMCEEGRQLSKRTSVLIR